jgi:hypothetical protein
MRKLLHLTGDSTAQALPLALVAMAMGTLLVSPFLVNVSGSLLASRHIDSTIIDYYSADAGVEWALWRLKNDPTLTASETYTEMPLQPTPDAVNGLDFPTTQIRYVPGAGMSEAVTPAWQSGGGPHCYDFSSSETGTIKGLLDVETNRVWVELLPTWAACARSPGVNPLSAGTPYTFEFSARTAGTYKLLVETDPQGAGTLTINYPVASYDIRSEINGRRVVVRATAGANAVRVISWQLE